MRRPPLRLLAEALRRFTDDGMADRAPALAYYGILSLFPLLLLAFSLVRLAGDSGISDDLAEAARDGGASSAVAGALRSAADTARAASVATAGSAGLAGLLALVYGSSRAFTAAGRALDAVAHRSTPGRTIPRRLEDVLWTLVVLAMVLVLLGVVLVSGRVLDGALSLVGLESQVDTWRLLRWPATIVAATLIVAVVRYAAPSSRPRFRLLTAGVLVSVGALVVETIGYDVYVTQVATYNTTYGAFAGAIILMLWVWLAAIAFLFGAEIDAAIGDRHQGPGGARPTPGRWRPGLSAVRGGGTVTSERSH